jgi:hypothetical protein
VRRGGLSDGPTRVVDEAVEQAGPVVEALESVSEDRQEVLDAADGEVAEAAFEVV